MLSLIEGLSCAIPAMLYMHVTRYSTVYIVDKKYLHDTRRICGYITK